MGEEAQVDPKGFMSIGTVAASNIALALNLPSEHVGVIEKAIRNEITAMSSHFTLAVADARDAYEVEAKKIKSTFSFVKTYPYAVIAFAVVNGLVGLAIGHFA